MAYYIIGLSITLYFLLGYLIEKMQLDYTLNIAQATVDASRATLLFEQIDNDTLDSELTDYKTFDLPFIDLSLCPTYWWDAIWEWDFWARGVVMQHFAAHSEVLWAEVPEFAE